MLVSNCLYPDSHTKKYSVKMTHRHFDTRHSDTLTASSFLQFIPHDRKLVGSAPVFAGQRRFAASEADVVIVVVRPNEIAICLH